MKKWWGAATKRQVVTLLQNNNTILRHDGYDEEDLEIGEEEKTWGSVLKITAVEDGKKKQYDFSIVQDWVNYPIKDPTKYLRVNWTPCIDYIKSKQRVTK